LKKRLHEREWEEPMRHHNRQARRVALCVGRRDPHGRQAGTSLKRAALTANGQDLAEVAARIADELDLSPDLVDLLSPVPFSD
jgi:hypothetical protein